MNVQSLNTEIEIRKSIRNWVLVFVIALVLSGITAFALETELAWLDYLFKSSDADLYFWIDKVYKALMETNNRYPFLAYGYDWLVFAHLLIAISFFGVIKDPIRNKWVVQFGRIACYLIFPLAFTAGYVRGIRFFGN
jgi:hypothetical protein